MGLNGRRRDPNGLGTLVGDLSAGAVGGALGTTVLNMVAYADIAVRGRPSSDVPEKVVAYWARRMGIVLDEHDEQTANRLTGIASLLGYATGIGMGAVYGAVRPRVRAVPIVWAGTGLGLAVMAATDSASIAAGATDPREWGVAGWVGDIIPHVFYGVAVAAAVDWIDAARRG